MNIKQLILTTSGLLLAGIVEAQSAHPNVILIYTDDHGSLDVNCFGAKDLCTPHMDALANQGVRFTQFYGAAVSSVSRASLLTGQFAKRAGLTVNAGGNSFLPVEKETIAERMKSNGYRTALIGKWHLGDRIEQGPNAQGFDYFWGIRGGCVDNYSHFYYWGGPNRHDLWQNEREIYSPGNFFAAENLKEIKEETLTQCFKAEEPWELVLPKVVEGPSVFKQNGVYYLIYSANGYTSQDYAVGFATSDSPFGPWKKYEGNPVLHKCDGLVGVGHGAPFVDMEGKMRYVFHAHKSESEIHPRNSFVVDMFVKDSIVSLGGNIVRPMVVDRLPSGK